MKIAVIGTGNVGSALARSFGRAGHEVTLGARDAGKTRSVAAEVGARAAENAAAAQDAEFVVLAVPYAGLCRSRRTRARAGRCRQDRARRHEPDQA